LFIKICFSSTLLALIIYSGNLTDAQAKEIIDQHQKELQAISKRS